MYSIANLDVSGGPVALDVPDSRGRYYVMQFVDAWTNNFAYVGRRATGTEAASYLLVPPDWSGEAGGEVTLIRLPTVVATIVGRWAVNGEADMPNVRALQDGLRLTPTGPSRGLPQPNPAVLEDLRFFEQLRVYMEAFTPAQRDLAYQERFEPLGLFASESPYVDADPELATSLRDGLAAGRKALESALSDSPSPEQNGWNLTYHIWSSARSRNATHRHWRRRRAQGRLRPTVGATVDWHDTGRALAALRSGEVAGKAVLPSKLRELLGTPDERGQLVGEIPGPDNGSPHISGV